MIATLVLLSTFSFITAYQATPKQTKATCLDNWHCTTATGEPVIPSGCAVSQDLLKSGAVHYHDWLYVEGHGYCYVNDTMNHRHTNSVDLFAWRPEDEKAVKPHKARVYKLGRRNVCH